MPCPNCNSRVDYLTHSSTDEDAPESYSRLCHVGPRERSEGRVVLVYHE